MPSSSTARNRFEKQGTGDNTNTWGQRLNTTGLDLIDEALDGYESIPVTGNLTLSSTNYSSDQARKRFLKFTGSAPATVTIPSVSKLYFIWNATTDNLIVTTGGGTVATLAPGAKQWVACDGVGVYTDTSMPIAVAAAASAAFSAASADESAESATASASAALSSATSASASANAAINSATAASASAASVNASNLVDRTTAQTVGGLKTFSDGVRINGQTLDGLSAFGVSLAEVADASAARSLIGVGGWNLITTVNLVSNASVLQTNLADYSELLVVLSLVRPNTGSSGLQLATSENNGSSYNGSVSVITTDSATPVSGSFHVALAGRASLVVSGPETGSASVVKTIVQTAKANAIRLEWPSATFGSGGVIYIYGR